MRSARELLISSSFCGLLAFAGCAPGAAAPPIASSASVPGAAVPPSAEEKTIMAAIDASNAADRELIERVVNINSGTMNFDGVRAVGAIFRAELDKLGFSTRWVPMDEVNRAGHLIAERHGKGKRLLLIGHLDTVFERDSPFQKLVRDGDTWTGPGVSDMKGGDVVMLSALRALDAAGVLADTNITIVLDGDEEKPGQPLSISRRELVEAGKRSDVAFCFEHTVRENGRDLATVGRRGSVAWTLNVSGQGGHSSQIFGEKLGSGAIFEASRILASFHHELREPNLTYSVGLLLGGTQIDLDPGKDTGSVSGKVNVLPARAAARGDLRALSVEQVQRTKGKMQAIVAQHLPKTDASIEFVEQYPPMTPSEGGRALLVRLNEVNRTLGEPVQEPADPMVRGAGDIAFVSSLVPSLSGFGLNGKGPHAPGESADIGRMPVVTKRAALFIYRLTRPESR